MNVLLFARRGGGEGEAVGRGQYSTVGMDWRPHTTHTALLAAETKLSGDLRREGGPLWEGEAGQERGMSSKQSGRGEVVGRGGG